MLTLLQHNTGYITAGDLKRYRSSCNLYEYPSASPTSDMYLNLISLYSKLHELQWLEFHVSSGMGRKVVRYRSYILPSGSPHFPTPMSLVLLTHNLQSIQSFEFLPQSNPFAGVRWLEDQADHSPPSIAKVRNPWSYTSTPTYIFRVITE